MKLLLLCAAVVTLAGCASTPEQRADACDGYGFQRGTEGHSICMQRVASGQAAEAAGPVVVGPVYAPAYAPVYRASPYYIPPPHYEMPITPVAPLDLPRIRQTNCIPVGNGVSCTTY